MDAYHGTTAGANLHAQWGGRDASGSDDASSISSRSQTYSRQGGRLDTSGITDQFNQVRGQNFQTVTDTHKRVITSTCHQVDTDLSMTDDELDILADTLESSIHDSLNSIGESSERQRVLAIDSAALFEIMQTFDDGPEHLDAGAAAAQVHSRSMIGRSDGGSQPRSQKLVKKVVIKNLTRPYEPGKFGQLAKQIAANKSLNLSIDDFRETTPSRSNPNPGDLDSYELFVDNAANQMVKMIQDKQRRNPASNDVFVKNDREQIRLLLRLFKSDDQHQVFDDIVESAKSKLERLPSGLDDAIEDHIEGFTGPLYEALGHNNLNTPFMTQQDRAQLQHAAAAQEAARAAQAAAQARSGNPGTTGVGGQPSGIPGGAASVPLPAHGTTGADGTAEFKGPENDDNAGSQSTQATLHAQQSQLLHRPQQLGPQQQPLRPQQPQQQPQQTLHTAPALAAQEAAAQQQQPTLHLDLAAAQQQQQQQQHQPQIGQPGGPTLHSVPALAEQAARAAQDAAAAAASAALDAAAAAAAAQETDQAGTVTTEDAKLLATYNIELTEMTDKYDDTYNQQDLIETLRWLHKQGISKDDLDSNGNLTQDGFRKLGESTRTLTYQSTDGKTFSNITYGKDCISQNEANPGTYHGHRTHFMRLAKIGLLSGVQCEVMNDVETKEDTALDRVATDYTDITYTWTNYGQVEDDDDSQSQSLEQPLRPDPALAEQAARAAQDAAAAAASAAQDAAAAAAAAQETDQAGSVTAAARVPLPGHRPQPLGQRPQQPQLQHSRAMAAAITGSSSSSSSGPTVRLAPAPIINQASHKPAAFRDTVVDSVLPTPQMDAISLPRPTSTLATSINNRAQSIRAKLSKQGPLYQFIDSLDSYTYAILEAEQSEKGDEPLRRKTMDALSSPNFVNNLATLDALLADIEQQLDDYQSSRSVGSYFSSVTGYTPEYNLGQKLASLKLETVSGQRSVSVDKHIDRMTLLMGLTKPDSSKLPAEFDKLIVSDLDTLMTSLTATPVAKQSADTKPFEIFGDEAPYSSHSTMASVESNYGKPGQLLGGLVERLKALGHSLPEQISDSIPRLQTVLSHMNNLISDPEKSKLLGDAIQHQMVVITDPYGHQTETSLMNFLAQTVHDLSNYPPKDDSGWAQLDARLNTLANALGTLASGVDTGKVMYDETDTTRPTGFTSVAHEATAPIQSEALFAGYEQIQGYAETILQNSREGEPSYSLAEHFLKFANALKEAREKKQTEAIQNLTHSIVFAQTMDDIVLELHRIASEHADLISTGDQSSINAFEHAIEDTLVQNLYINDEGEGATMHPLATVLQTMTESLTSGNGLTETEANALLQQTKQLGSSLRNIKREDMSNHSFPVWDDEPSQADLDYPYKEGGNVVVVGGDDAPGDQVYQTPSLQPTDSPSVAAAAGEPKDTILNMTNGTRRYDEPIGKLASNLKKSATSIIRKLHDRTGAPKLTAAAMTFEEIEKQLHGISRQVDALNEGDENQKQDAGRLDNFLNGEALKDTLVMYSLLLEIIDSRLGDDPDDATIADLETYIPEFRENNSDPSTTSGWYSMGVELNDLADFLDSDDDAFEPEPRDTVTKTLDRLMTTAWLKLVHKSAQHDALNPIVSNIFTQKYWAKQDIGRKNIAQHPELRADFNRLWPKFEEGLNDLYLSKSPIINEKLSDKQFVSLGNKLKIFQLDGTGGLILISRPAGADDNHPFVEEQGLFEAFAKAGMLTDAQIECLTQTSQDIAQTMSDQGDNSYQAVDFGQFKDMWVLEDSDDASRGEIPEEVRRKGQAPAAPMRGGAPPMPSPADLLRQQQQQEQERIASATATLRSAAPTTTPEAQAAPGNANNGTGSAAAATPTTTTAATTPAAQSMPGNDNNNGTASAPPMPGAPPMPAAPPMPGAPPIPGPPPMPGGFTPLPSPDDLRRLQQQQPQQQPQQQQPEQTGSATAQSVTPTSTTAAPAGNANNGTGSATAQSATPTSTTAAPAGNANNGTGSATAQSATPTSTTAAPAGNANNGTGSAAAAPTDPATSATAAATATATTPAPTTTTAATPATTPTVQAAAAQTRNANNGTGSAAAAPTDPATSATAAAAGTYDKYYGDNALDADKFAGNFLFNRRKAPPKETRRTVTTDSDSAINARSMAVKLLKTATNTSPRSILQAGFRRPLEPAEFAILKQEVTNLNTHFGMPQVATAQETNLKIGQLNYALRYLASAGILDQTQLNELFPAQNSGSQELGRLPKFKPPYHESKEDSPLPQSAYELTRQFFRYIGLNFFRFGSDDGFHLKQGTTRPSIRERVLGALDLVTPEEKEKILSYLTTVGILESELAPTNSNAVPNNGDEPSDDDLGIDSTLPFLEKLSAAAKTTRVTNSMASSGNTPSADGDKDYVRVFEWVFPNIDSSKSGTIKSDNQDGKKAKEIAFDMFSQATKGKRSILEGFNAPFNEEELANLRAYRDKVVDDQTLVLDSTERQANINNVRRAILVMYEAGYIDRKTANSLDIVGTNGPIATLFDRQHPALTHRSDNIEGSLRAFFYKIGLSGIQIPTGNKQARYNLILDGSGKKQIAKESNRATLKLALKLMHPNNKKDIIKILVDKKIVEHGFGDDS